MPNWVSITIANVYDVKVAALVVACQSAALGASQTDPSPRIIQEVIDRIRAEVAGCRSNAVDSDLTTIPKSLVLLASRMISRALKDRLEIGLTEQEMKQWSIDEDYLKRIQKCDVPIDTPDNPITAPVEPGSSAQIVRPGRSVDRCELGGLT